MFSDTLDWEQFSLGTQLRLSARGNVTIANNDDRDPVNDWDGYRMAAVYSPIFHDGPQARLFYRQQSLDESSVIQELIWNLNGDHWSEGHNFTDSWPNSHMAATIDESTNILRLLFSTGNKTLQEYWIDISTPNAIYAKGTPGRSSIHISNSRSLRVTPYLQVFRFLTSFPTTTPISPLPLSMAQRTSTALYRVATIPSTRPSSLASLLP